MTVNIRLDEELEQLLNQTVQALKRTKTEIIKASLREYCSKVLREHRPSPYVLIEDLIGKEGSGRGDLSTRGREHILEMMHAKRGGHPC